MLMFAGFVLFFGTHLMQVFPALRASLIGAIGEIPYKIAYSVVALAGVVLIAQGYSAWRFEGSIALYSPPVWMRHIALLLMIPAFVLLVASNTPSHIRTWVRHPMITAVKVWALAHLLANGDAAGVALFGAFLAWAVISRISLKRRERAGGAVAAVEPRWSADAIVVAIGLVLYALFVWKLHLWLIGVSPIAM